MSNPTPTGPSGSQNDPTLKPIESELESRPTKAIKLSDLDAIAGEESPRVRPLWWRILTDPFTIVLYAAIAILICVSLVPRGLWLLTPAPKMQVALVDYTVPYASAREHRGVSWTLNHLKYTPLSGGVFGNMTSHIGYRPSDRANPTTIAGSDLSRVNWLYVADAYGVYKADLVNVEQERGHLDFSEKVFGGLSDADADSIVAFSERGGHVFMEFNTIEDPTRDAARAKLEQLLGIQWTGWVGRTFETLEDTIDVPRWVKRRNAELNPGRELPTGRVLLLIHRDGRMFIESLPDPDDVVPRTHLTDAGAQMFSDAVDGTPYEFWFPIMRAQNSTQILAELQLPPTDAMRSLLAAEGLTPAIPLLMRRTEGGSHRIYMAADLAEIPFDPGRYDIDGPLWLRQMLAFGKRRYEGKEDYWRFYVPIVRTLLRAPEVQ